MTYAYIGARPGLSGLSTEAAARRSAALSSDTRRKVDGYGPGGSLNQRVLRVGEHHRCSTADVFLEGIPTLPGLTISTPR